MLSLYQNHAQLALVAGAIVLGCMLLTWWIGKAVRNYAIVDAVWSFLFAPVALIYAVMAPGEPERRLILSLMVSMWSIRLGLHLAKRIAGEHPREDRRYAALREEWSDGADRRMLGFYLVQGLLIIVLSAPFLMPMFNQNPGLHSLELTGIMIFLAGILGESVSDSQLARFKRVNHGSQPVCEVGLWRYSRHPNYFFEWLIWVGFATFALPSAGGWIGLIAPVLMLHFLLNVTGIPMTEELAVARKGDAYRRYQQTTSRFVPWPRKEK